MENLKLGRCYCVWLLFCLLCFNSYNSFAEVVVNDEIHYIGKVVFPISVSSGAIVITDVENNATTLSAGMDYNYTAQTNRTSWVQPADGGFLYGGVENTMGWTVYSDASSYLMEYNFPNPVFSEENPEVPEYLQQSIAITPDMYSIYEEVVVLNMIMPELPDTIVEARIYPVDDVGNVIGHSVASDKIILSFE